MKTFTISLLSIILVALITSSIPPIIADESIDNEEYFEDSKYKIYLHVLVRNAQGELVTVAETLPCELRSICSEYMDHEVTDYAFDELGKKEIITIDDIKYEKIQFSDSYGKTANTITYYNQYLFDMYDREPTGRWVVKICGESLKQFGFECAKIFQSRTSIVWLEVGDVTTSNWTVLKKIN